MPTVIHQVQQTTTTIIRDLSSNLGTYVSDVDMKAIISKNVRLIPIPTTTLTKEKESLNHRYVIEILELARKSLLTVNRRFSGRLSRNLISTTISSQSNKNYVKTLIQVT